MEGYDTNLSLPILRLHENSETQLNKRKKNCFRKVSKSATQMSQQREQISQAYWSAKQMDQP